MFISVAMYYDERKIDAVAREHKECKKLVAKDSIACSSTIYFNNIEHSVYYKTHNEQNRNQIWYYSNGKIKKVFVNNCFLKEFDRFGERVRHLDLKTGEEEVGDEFPKITIKVSNRQDLLKGCDASFVVFERIEYYPRSYAVKSKGFVVKNMKELNECWREGYVGWSFL